MTDPQTPSQDDPQIDAPVDASVEKARWIVDAGLERKAERPIVMDMRNLTSYADVFIVLTGRSDRQVRAIAEGIITELKQRGEAPIGVEGLDDGNWVLIDCNDAIVHVFDEETRIQFDLERLWRDAPRIDLEIPGIDPNPDRLPSAGLSEEEEDSAAGPAA
jgi:ribosome-associated protein